MNFNPGQFGKLLVLLGLMLLTAGLLVAGLSKPGFRLPGDLEWTGRNWKIYVPLTSCLIISAILMLIVWLIYLFRW
jgi:hypothetical protein